MMNRFEWMQAKSLQEAAKSSTCTVAQLITDGKGPAGGNTSIIKAGGVDIIDLMKEGLLQPARLVNIRMLPELHTSAYENGKGMMVGPLMTLTEIAQNKEVSLKYKALSEAASQVASPNIRNAATIGGNLLQRPHCWYFRSADFHCLRKGGSHCFASDGENKYHAIFDNVPCAIVHPSTTAVALVALGATIDLLSGDGKKRNVKLENFFVGPTRDFRRENLLAPGELITAIRLPDNKLRSAYVKLGEKDSFDWPIVDCAVALEMNGSLCKQASIIIGAVAPTPWRAREAESMLAGKTLSDGLVRQAAALGTKQAKPLAQNAYKVELVPVIVAKAILLAAQNKA